MPCQAIPSCILHPPFSLQSVVDPERIRCCHRTRLTNKTYSAIQEQRTKQQIVSHGLFLFWWWCQESGMSWPKSFFAAVSTVLPPATLPSAKLIIVQTYKIGADDIRRGRVVRSGCVGVTQPKHWSVSPFSKTAFWHKLYNKEEDQDQVLPWYSFGY